MPREVYYLGASEPSCGIIHSGNITTATTAFAQFCMTSHLLLLNQSVLAEFDDSKKCVPKCLADSLARGRKWPVKPDSITDLQGLSYRTASMQLKPRGN